jgi:hypothetical protein
MKRFIVVAAMLVLAASVAWGQTPKPGDPIPVKADGRPIDIEGVGRAAPFYADIDGDNIPDLLVGEYQDGKCRIYHNYGTATKPVFRNFKYLQAGGEIAVIPPG